MLLRDRSDHLALRVTKGLLAGEGEFVTGVGWVESGVSTIVTALTLVSGLRRDSSEMELSIQTLTTCCI
jgi:hypothetical protein